MMYAEALEKGTEYSVKLTFMGRKGRYYYEGITRVYSSETEYKEVYQFLGKGGTRWVTDEHIESIEIAKPLKPKQKTGKTCPRCLGNKVYQKFAHVNGGRCFRCEGTGTV